MGWGLAEVSRKRDESNGAAGGRSPDVEEGGQHAKEEGTGLLIDAGRYCKEMPASKEFLDVGIAQQRARCLQAIAKMAWQGGCMPMQRVNSLWGSYLDGAVGGPLN